MSILLLTVSMCLKKLQEFNVTNIGSVQLCLPLVGGLTKSVLLAKLNNLVCAYCIHGLLKVEDGQTFYLTARKLDG